MDFRINIFEELTDKIVFQFESQTFCYCHVVGLLKIIFSIRAQKTFARKTTLSTLDYRWLFKWVRTVLKHVFFPNSFIPVDNFHNKPPIAVENALSCSYERLRPCVILRTKLTNILFGEYWLTQNDVSYDVWVLLTSIFVRTNVRWIRPQHLFTVWRTLVDHQDREDINKLLIIALSQGKLKRNKWLFHQHGKRNSQYMTCWSSCMEAAMFFSSWYS